MFVRGIGAFILSGVAIVAAVVGCGRDTDFLTHQPKEIILAHRYDHPLRELQGTNKVDILFVVDNSGSMGVHQANLNKNAKVFIDKFVVGNRMDWRIGVLSADPANPPYVGMPPNDLLDRTLRDPVTVFQTAVSKLGTSGSAEQPLDAAIKGLKDNPGFMRPGATLAIIIITDAKEQSSVDGLQFLAAIKALQASKGQLIVYGVLANLEFGCQTQEDPYDFKTSPYNVAFEATKGKYYKLCEDFGPNLADLGNDLVTRIDRPYIQLASRPYINTVKVIHKGKELEGGPLSRGGYWLYDFDLNRIVFNNLDFAPEENEVVTIAYEGYTEQVKLPPAPEPKK